MDGLDCNYFPSLRIELMLWLCSIGLVPFVLASKLWETKCFLLLLNSQPVLKLLCYNIMYAHKPCHFCLLCFLCHSCIFNSDSMMHQCNAKHSGQARSIPPAVIDGSYSHAFKSPSVTAVQRQHAKLLVSLVDTQKETAHFFAVSVSTAIFSYHTFIPSSYQTSGPSCIHYQSLVKSH